MRTESTIAEHSRCHQAMFALEGCTHNKPSYIVARAQASGRRSERAGGQAGGARASGRTGERASGEKQKDTDHDQESYISKNDITMAWQFVIVECCRFR